jgi:hypothetical protein
VDNYGHLTHTIEDFYSHTGWVDPSPIGLGFGTGRGALVDHGLDNWQILTPYQILHAAPGYDLVVLEGEPDPTKYTLEIGPNTVVPTVTNLETGLTYPGLITSGGNSNCPDIVEFEHGGHFCTDEVYEGCFNHDDNDHVRWQEAFNAAIYQTEHEWCRLLHMVHDQKGAAGSSLLMTLAVGRDELPNTTPHKMGTACEWNPYGPIEVEVRATDVKVRPFGPPTTKAWFGIYTDDFRDSRRALIDLEDPVLPVERMCLEPSDTLVVSMWGWQDLNPPEGSGWGYYEFPYEPIVQGVYSSFDYSSSFGEGKHTVWSRDMMTIRMDYPIALRIIMGQIFRIRTATEMVCWMERKSTSTIRIL